MKLRRNNRRKSEDEETSYWLSYSDMMAGLLLVFVLIISFTILQSTTQFEQKEEELAEQALIIYSQQEDLSDQEAQLLEAQGLLDEQQSLLDEQQSELEEQQSALEQVQALLANQEALLAEKEALLGEQQEQLDQIIGVRAELIEALKNAFEGTSLSVSVDSNTGAITLDSSVLFEVDEYELSEAGEELLREFIPIYLSVLLSDEFSEYVSEIIIEGHTDTDGDYIHNLELSQQRALSVATFCLDEDSNIISSSELAALREILTANGRSYSDPIYAEDGSVDMDASRRVEFKFRLKDEDMVQEMIEILNGTADTETQTDEDAATEE